MDVAAKEFAQMVLERTNGMVEIQVFPAQQLGNEQDMVESLPLGTMDIGIIVGGPYGYIQPEFELLSLVYLFEEPANAYKAMHSEVGEELADLMRLRKRANCIMLDASPPM